MNSFEWLSIKVGPNEIFQFSDYLSEFRLVKVLSNTKYTVTPLAKCKRGRKDPALAKVTNGVLAIAG